jgi:hypothetical protein
MSKNGFYKADRKLETYDKKTVDLQTKMFSLNLLIFKLLKFTTNREMRKQLSARARADNIRLDKPCLKFKLIYIIILDPLFGDYENKLLDFGECENHARKRVADEA